MTQITVQDGKIVLRDGKVGTGDGCCCSGGPSSCEDCDPLCCVAKRENNIFTGEIECKDAGDCACYTVACDCDDPDTGVPVGIPNCDAPFNQCYACDPPHPHFAFLANAIAYAEQIEQTLPENCYTVIYDQFNLPSFQGWVQEFSDCFNVMQDTDFGVFPEVLCCLATADDLQ